MESFSQHDQEASRPSDFQSRDCANGEFSELLLDTVASLVVVLDREGRIVRFNKACERATGYSFAEVQGKHVFDLFLLEEEREHVREVFGHLSAGDFPNSYENYWRAKDGQLRLISWTNTAMADERRQVRYVIATGIDVTEQKQWQQKLQRMNRELTATRDAAVAASRAKSAFLANMSHELRTPLNAIIGYAEMLQEDAPALGAAPLCEDLERILMAARHLLTLISDILDLSKIEAGRISVHLGEFSVADMLEEVRLTAEPLMKHNANRFETLCPADPGRMYSDGLKLRQVLLNLLSNAAKFTENGTITLEVQRERGSVKPWIRFRVADTGIGMTSDQVGSLFEKFYQADALITRKHGGTGLGLALSKCYCEALGGFISVESRPGAGSVFTVHLPVDAVAEEN